MPGPGPNVSDQMDTGGHESASQTLLAAESRDANVIRLQHEGKNGDALRAGRALFGKLFPLS